MSKYTKYRVKQEEKKGMNPIWRGIGCILIVAVPVLSFGLMVLFVPPIMATGKVPYQLVGHVQFPTWAYQVAFTADIARFFSNINNLWLNIITFFVMAMILTTVSSLLYSWIYSLVGPARYTALDAPPPKHQGRQYKR